MGSEAVSLYNKRVRIAFVAVALLLPLQLYVVLTKDNLYPCVHMPGFEPVLDDGNNLYYTDRTLVAINGNEERIPVIYSALFSEMPEYFARHTMNRLFAAVDTETIALDAETKKWLHQRLQIITGKTDIKSLEVDTFGYRHDKTNPEAITVTLEYTLHLNFDE